MSDWFKSSYSNPSGNCVTTRRTDGGMDVKDSKDPDSPVLSFDKATWEAFLRSL